MKTLIRLFIKPFYFIIVLYVTILLCSFPHSVCYAADEKEIVLNNGLRVFIKPMRAAPVVTVNYWVKNGSIFESDNEAGFSELVSKLLFQSSVKYPNHVLENHLEKLGVKVSKNSSNDCQSYCFTGTSKNFYNILNLTLDGLFNANFTENDIKKSIHILKNEIAELETRPDVVVHNSMMQEAFAVHPCRRPYYGLNPKFERADLFFLNRYYNKNYTPSNTILIITGDVNEASVLQNIQKLMENIKTNPYVEPELPKEIPQTSYREIVKYADLQKVYLSFGWKIPIVESSDRYALFVLAKLLGGSEDSILWKRLARGRKTCEFVNAGYEASRFQGIFVISAISAKSKYKYFIDDVRKIANGFFDEYISEQTLEEVKKAVINEDIFEREGVESSALDYGSFAVISKASDADEFESGIISVSLEDIKRVALEYLRDENLTVAILQAPTVSEDATPIMLTLDNGLKIILKENHAFPVISVSAKFVGESLKEDKKNAGIACLAAELLYRSFDSDDKTFRGKLEKIGAKLSYKACKNYISFDLKTVSSNFIPAFDLFIKMIDKPEFPTAYSIARSVLENILRVENQNLGLQNDYNTLKILFNNSPLSYSVYGRLEDLSKTKRSEVIDFYKKNFIPSNMVIAIVGDFYASELREYLLSTLGSFSTHKSSNKDSSKDSSKTSNESENNKNDSLVLTKTSYDEAYISFMAKTFPISNKKFIALELACRILENNLKYSFLKADKTGLLSSSVEIKNTSNINDGYFKASVVTDFNSVASISQLLNLEIEAFKVSNIPDYKLQEAKDSLYAEYTLGLTDSMALADAYSRDEVLGLGFDYYSKFDGLLASITVNDVLNVAKEFMLPENKYIIGVTSSNINELLLDGKKLVFKSSIQNIEEDNQEKTTLKDSKSDSKLDNKTEKKSDSKTDKKDSKQDKKTDNKSTTDNKSDKKDLKQDKKTDNKSSTDNKSDKKDLKQDKKTDNKSTTTDKTQNTKYK